MLSNNVPLNVQRFEQNALSPVFHGAVSSLNLLEVSCLFREYLKCIQLKSCVKSASNYFYCFNGFKSVTMVMCQMGMLLNLVHACCYSSLSTKGSSKKRAHSQQTLGGSRRPLCPPCSVGPDIPHKNWYRTTRNTIICFINSSIFGICKSCFGFTSKVLESFFYYSFT